MVEPIDEEINVDELMERIRENVRKKKGIFTQGDLLKSNELPSQSPSIQPPPASQSPMQQTATKTSCDHFAHPPYSSPVNFNNLQYYINYHGFLEQAKNKEGLKGKIKFHLFKFIRYFGWWQEQINRALYQELMAQAVRMDEREKRIQELHNEQMNKITDELTKRDEKIEDLDSRLIFLNQAKEDLFRKLSHLGAKVEEAERRMEGFLHRQADHIESKFAEQDKTLGDLKQQINLFGRAKAELYQELIDQKGKIDSTREWMESLLRQEMEEIKGEMAERDMVIDFLNKSKLYITHMEEKLSREVMILKEKLDWVEKHAKDLSTRELGSLRIELTEFYKNLKEDMDATKKELSGLLEAKSTLNGLTNQLREQKLTILDQQRRLSLFFEETRKRFSEQIGPKQIRRLLNEEEHLLDAIYVAFENRFRGTREEIKERLKVYLPYIKRAKGDKENFLILDLGCGRGEWLELLREEGHLGKGVDHNRIMVNQCQEIGLDVVESDAMEYLKSQRSQSLGAITGFHLLEHLPFKELVSLLDEAFRTLTPGGIVIFETPNPENLIVGAFNFYLDPTHLNPLPPGLLTFLLEARGFVKTEVLRLNPSRFVREDLLQPCAVKELINLVNKEQDYAVVAYKDLLKS